MIVYSASPDRALVVEPGERLVYGENENSPQGFGEVCRTAQGELVVNGQPVQSVVASFNWVRKVPVLASSPF